MIDFLCRHFVKDSDNIDSPAVRERYGRLSGVVGILCNTVLFTSKLIVGALFNSIAITADGVNNLSDAGSSVITLVGFRMAGKPADRDHPFGHARIEYITGLIVSFLILLIGFDIGRSSLDKVLHPEAVEFSILSVCVLAVSIFLKLWMGMFNRRLGRKIKSAALEATAADSLNDVYSTSAVLAATLIGKFTGWQLDGWMGLCVAAFILVSGVKLVRETLDPLLGQPPEEEMVRVISQKVMSYEGILGIHDLVVHSYGPGQYFASLHAEVDAKQDMLTCHDLIDKIERDVSADNIHLVIHMDPLITDDEVTNRLREETSELVLTVDPRLSIHDFRVVTGANHRNLVFDVTMPPEVKMTEEQLRQTLCRLISLKDPNLYAVITVDSSYVSLPKEYTP